MARMIPPRPVPTSSPGEPEIFARLRDDPGTDTWIVLHSLDIARHRTQLSGEADFIIVVPSKGVLFVEVKACSKLSRVDGMWYLGTAAGETRGPFRQSAEAMHSLRGTLTKARPALSRVPFFSCVIFTHAPFNLASIEWHAWQAIDSRQLRSGPISRLLGKVLEEGRKELAASNTGAGWFHLESKEPYVEQCEEIADFFRPDYECIQDYKSIALQVQAELKRYTDEQLTALDAMESNPRVVFHGPAGTGKTILALEAARRASIERATVLVVCFNQLLAESLTSECQNTHSSAKVATIHAHMLAVSGLTHIPIGASTEFWVDELPTRAIEALLQRNDDSCLYERLIVDEAQDILRPTYLDFLDLCLRGGLSAGKWRMFGDFNNQAIFDAANMTLGNFYSRLATRPVEFSLRINCRNTPSVATIAEYFGHLNPGYKRILRPHDGLEPRMLFYKNIEEQIHTLETTLLEFVTQGRGGRDIVILSFKKDESSAAQFISATSIKSRLRKYGSSDEGYIRYCSISAFKGLEAPIVIVTDIEQMDRNHLESLMYVAVSRATHQLILLIQDGAKAMLLPANSMDPAQSK